MTATKTPLLIANLEQVEMTYDGSRSAVRALRGVDLDLYRDEFVVVLGPSGSGKTTLLNVIGGIETATSGYTIVAGADLAALDETAKTEFRRTHIGFVFQFFNLIPTLTALENVQLIAELLELDGSRAEAVLHDVGLGDRMNHFPAELSGGEQQRVAIARALVKQPPLLLCDEPTGSLDLDTGRHILTLLRNIQDARGGTVVLVTHNRSIAAIADRVVTMGSGQIRTVETIDQPLRPDEVTW